MTPYDLGLEDSSYGGYQVTNVYEGTVSDELKAGALGETLSKIFEAKLKLSKLTENKEAHQRKLQDIQTSMTALGEVFGFDTYEHLEMFMAAWLMKDSTCRLSGIHGTGKTTVIESAAVLLCNSYGQSSKVRYLVPEGRSYSDDQRFGADRAYPAQEFPAGMTYAIDYSNEAYAAVYNNWNKWRFTPCLLPLRSPVLTCMTTSSYMRLVKKPMNPILTPKRLFLLMIITVF